MSFKDIKGQDKPIQIIKEYIKNSHLTGSYLFTGEEGIGKKLTAKTLAKAINCASGISDSCDKCATCLKIERDSHPDVYCINTDDSDSIKIERIRQMQKALNLKSYEGKKKIFIINNAQDLTPDAENALLKILEEPPPESLIILVSAKPALLFKTIISRCKVIKFYPLKKIQLDEILKKDYFLDHSLAHFLAYFCEGSLGRALRLIDKDILREKNRIIDALALSGGSVSRDLSSDNNRNNMRSYLNILAGWFRDMYLVKIGIPDGELINLDRKEQLLMAMERYTWPELDQILHFVSNSLLYLEQNVNIKLLLSNLREATTYGAAAMRQANISCKAELTPHHF